jgi:hypothetical protein
MFRYNNEIQLQYVQLSRTINSRKLIGASGATFDVDTTEKFEDDSPLCCDKEALVVT